MSFINLLNSITAFLVAITGFFVAIKALLPHINKLKRKWRKKKGKIDMVQEPPIKNRRVLLGVLLGIFLLIISAVIFTAQITPKIKITYPKDGDKVPVNFTVNGTISGELPNEKYMWIFTYAQSRPYKWWPQGERIIPQNGQWSMQVWILNKPSDVSIVVALVNKEDDQDLFDYGDRGDKTGNYSSIPRPKSARVVANITVT